METIFNSELMLDPEFNEATSAININKNYVTYMGFILTDSFANLNKQRIPEEEFDNLIKTGYCMPIKAAAIAEEGGIRKGHDGAFPLGAILSLKKSGHQIKGIAALWTREREDDIVALKSMMADGIPINLSWEVGYTDSSVSEDGVEDLLGTQLRASTIVGLPAYAGRTTVLALSSVQDGKEEPTETTEKSNLEGNQIEMEEQELKIKSLEDTVSAKDIEIQTLREQLSSLQSEVEELKSYKNEIETAKAEQQKIENIKSKFSSFNIVQDEQYFIDNKETLLKLGETELDFMIQQIVAFSSAPEGESSSSKIPNIHSTKKIYTPKELGKALQESKSSK